MINMERKLKIDLMDFVSKYNGKDYGVVLLMAEKNLIVENDIPKVCIDRHFIEDINSMSYDETVNEMDNIQYRFIIEERPTIIEVNGVTEQELKSSYNLKRMIEMSSLVIWEDIIIKDRKDINMYRSIPVPNIDKSIDDIFIEAAEGRKALIINRNK